LIAERHVAYFTFFDLASLAYLAENFSAGRAFTGGGGAGFITAAVGDNFIVSRRAMGATKVAETVRAL
jgi:hypothetical protein